jgi:hypothetical protein
MQKLAIKWNILIGMISLIIGFILGGMPGPQIFFRVSIYALVFYVISAIFLGIATHQLLRKEPSPK